MKTNKPTHTPGPWAVYPAERFGVNVLADGGRIVVQLYRQDYDCENRQAAMMADAELIAAAPDLLDALRDALFHLEAHASGKTGMAMTQHDALIVAKNVSAAILRAEGSR